MIPLTHARFGNKWLSPQYQVRPRRDSHPGLATPQRLDGLVQRHEGPSQS